jgi:hypothetical protein
VQCGARDSAQCESNGCSEVTCRPAFEDYEEPISCTILSATDCAKAAGCALVSGKCTGDTLCGPQTDANVCDALGNCYFGPGCAGPKLPECSTLSVAACQATLGCRIEW